MSKNEKFDLPLSETDGNEKKIHKGRIILIASAVSAVLLFVFILIFQNGKNEATVHQNHAGYDGAAEDNPIQTHLGLEGVKHIILECLENDVNNNSLMLAAWSHF